MAAGAVEVASIIASCGVAAGAVVRPVCRWLMTRTYVNKANAEDVPAIAKAMHPQVELHRRTSRRSRAGER